MICSGLAGACKDGRRVQSTGTGRDLGLAKHAWNHQLGHCKRPGTTWSRLTRSCKPKYHAACISEPMVQTLHAEAVRRQPRTQPIALLASGNPAWPLHKLTHLHTRRSAPTARPSATTRANPPRRSHPPPARFPAPPPLSLPMDTSRAPVSRRDSQGTGTAACTAELTKYCWYSLGYPPPASFRSCTWPGSGMAGCVGGGANRMGAGTPASSS